MRIPCQSIVLDVTTESMHAAILGTVVRWDGKVLSDDLNLFPGFPTANSVVRPVNYGRHNHIHCRPNYRTLPTSGNH